MSNFERTSLGWEPLQLNREQQHQESNQEEQGEESEDPCSSIRELNIAPAPKTRSIGLGKVSHWGYCPKHGTFSGDNCDELPPHE